MTIDCDLMTSNGYNAFQEPYGPNDNQMDLRSRTQLLIYHGR